MQAVMSANGTERPTDWNSVNWRKANRHVRNLRQRIFRASQAGNLKKVRSLQKLMLRSYSNTLMSVRQVTQVNAGKHTPGVDKVVVKTPQARGGLVDPSVHLPTLELLESEIKPLVETFMRERGLQLSAEKTLITHITDGFDFLGQTIRRYSDGKVLVKPSKKNVSTFLAQIRKVITDNAQATAGHLIAQLNPKIRGWANYHRHVSSKQSFVMVDNAIFKALWQWAVRRHPKKSKKWVKEKYFYSIAHRNWVFCGMAEGKDGNPYRVRLFYAAEVAIKRHTKIRGEANPYDPAWDAYYEARLGVKMVQHLEGRGQLLYLWQEQNGVCPVCGQKIIELTGWNNHHLVKRVDGGSDRADNRLLLHPNCHRQVHSQRLEVVKLRSDKSV